MLLSFKNHVFSPVTREEQKILLLSKALWRIFLVVLLLSYLNLPSYPLLMDSGCCLLQHFQEMWFIFCVHPGCNKACLHFLASLLLSTTAPSAVPGPIPGRNSRHTPYLKIRYKTLRILSSFFYSISQILK